MSVIGNYLKNIREEKELSLRQVDIKCGVHYSVLSLIESGKRMPTAIVLKKLADAYGLDSIELYKMAGFIDYAESKEKEKKLHIPILRKNPSWNSF